MISLALFTAAVVFYTLSQSANFKDAEGWKNKYKQPMTPAPDNLYYKLFKLKYRESFPLSGSFLVAFTDGYHAWQLLFKVALCASIILYKPILGRLDGLIYFLVFGIVFTVVFRSKH